MSASESQHGLPKNLFPHHTPAAASSSTEESKDANGMTKLPNGVILDKDGKPCRLCTSAASWRNLTKQAKAQTATSTTAATTTAPKPVPESTSLPQSQDDCPPDVEALGRSTWTFLHSLTASYPVKATQEQQGEMRTFLKIFSRLYPCWVCADDFRTWMAEPSGRNEPRLAGRADFGTWMCEAHNEVNRKLGKKEFDCRFWEERWRTGWKDGRCD
ncbi:FAD dependent sulfhydryl oxidase Erv1 [Aspergillus nomiae NRRL 13137]|uniref:Sulfhydryl oxidase n=1 Tax=Aspergillus nomiae NRRL (strain ATCC 15546 / NRRL 13137 / CBS 260.88 / M93) TaxID=1509407 RepID=A0A0L1IY89_ASPN3|nr:FAD dependent sulfhydryl oxidase Erv1 [Aspergillus nomiae NRRL 13137]KNG84454.1 FAD dependent sulfhydryl oxidase Erv1 [Aspergillus nomiae NRRL 13137]